MKKKLFVATVLSCIVVCAAFAQQVRSPQGGDKGGGSGSSSSSGSSSTAANTVNITQGGGGNVEALPGPAVAGPIAGPVLANGDWKIVINPLLKSISTGAMKAIRKPKGKITCSRMAAQNEIPLKNNESVRLVRYDPEVNRPLEADPHDSVLGTCWMIGDYQPADELYIETIVKGAKDFMPGATRVAVYTRRLSKTVGKENLLGFGIAGSSSSHPVGGSFGYGHGSISTMVQDPPQLEVVILNNDGPIDLPPPKPQQEKQQEASPTVVSPPASPADIHAEVQTTPAVPETPLAAKPEAKPEPAVAQDPCADFANLHFSVKWAIDRPSKEDAIPGKPYRPKASDFWTDPKERNAGSKSFQEWLAEIKRGTSWISSHPECKLQSVGHASAEASDRYNVLLGDRRGWAIDYLLRQNGLTTENLKQWVSLGKRQLVHGSEYNSNSRYVDLEAIGPETGP